MFELKGRVAVITGASSGLGKQMTRAFAKQGADLVILARRLERLEELKEELEKEYEGIKVLPIKCDVTSTEDINAAAAKAKEVYGKVDILVNCAGSAKNAGVLTMTDDEWDFTISTDQTSVFKMTRAFANIMKENNYGRIINIASMYGLVGNTALDTVAYHSSKGGVVNFTVLTIMGDYCRAVVLTTAYFVVVCLSLLSLKDQSFITQYNKVRELIIEKIPVPIAIIIYVFAIVTYWYFAMDEIYPDIFIEFNANM